MLGRDNLRRILTYRRLIVLFVLVAACGANETHRTAPSWQVLTAAEAAPEPELVACIRRNHPVGSLERCGIAVSVPLPLPRSFDVSQREEFAFALDLSDARDGQRLFTCRRDVRQRILYEADGYLVGCSPGPRLHLYVPEQGNPHLMEFLRDTSPRTSTQMHHADSDVGSYYCPTGIRGWLLLKSARAETVHRWEILIGYSGVGDELITRFKVDCEASRRR